MGEFQIPTFGKHNVLNATAVIANLYIAGFDLALAAEHLKTFGGVKRRFTEKVVNGTVIIDDFAHHPTEIIATIDAARMAAMASSVCALGEAVAREAGLGNYVSATIEAAQGRAILYAIPRADVPLVLHLLASEQSMLAHIMYAARQTADTLSAS